MSTEQHDLISNASAWLSQFAQEAEEPGSGQPLPAPGDLGVSYLEVASVSTHTSTVSA